MTRRSPDIRIKRVYDPVSEDDGARVLVDRLWPRGLRKENATWGLWLKDIAPSPELRAWFGHAPQRFAEFARRYRAELAAIDGAVEPLDELVKGDRVTLLYAAHDVEHNHALVLAEFLRDHWSGRS